MQTIKQSDINTCDGFAYHGHSPLAVAVQEFEHLTYKNGWQINHSGIFIRDNGELMVSEAELGGVHNNHFSCYINKAKENGKDILICLKPTFQCKAQETLIRSLQLSGNTKYDLKNLTWWQLVRMITKDKIWLGGNKNDNKFICGERMAWEWNFYTDFCENPSRYAPAQSMQDVKLIPYLIDITS